jgi:DNA-binding NarL/FixJ family response regulator
MLLLGAWAAADRIRFAGATGQPASRRQIADLSRELQALATAATTGPCGRAPRHFFAWNEAVRTRWSAELSRLGGHDDPTVWIAAAERWQRLHRPYFEGYCLLRAVEAAAAHKASAVDIEKWFDAALTIANRLRATWLQQQLQALGARLQLSLPRSASRPDRDGSASGAAAASSGLTLPGGPDSFGLTSREREVLALLATGLTNAQLASQLFISTHTANVHVSRILTKLGVPNRTQAANVAWATGLAMREHVVT